MQARAARAQKILALNGAIWHTLLNLALFGAIWRYIYVIFFQILFHKFTLSHEKA